MTSALLNVSLEEKNNVNLQDEVVSELNQHADPPSQTKIEVY